MLKKQIEIMLQFKPNFYSMLVLTTYQSINERIKIDLIIQFDWISFLVTGFCLSLDSSLVYHPLQYFLVQEQHEYLVKHHLVQL